MEVFCQCTCPSHCTGDFRIKVTVLVSASVTVLVAASVTVLVAAAVTVLVAALIVGIVYSKHYALFFLAFVVFMLDDIKVPELKNNALS